MTVHIGDIGESFVAVGTAVRGSGVQVEFGLAVETHRAAGAVLVEADNEVRRGVVRVDLFQVTSEVGPVGERPGAYVAG